MVKNLPANAGDVGLIPGSGISPGEGNGSPLQYSCLENTMDRGAWWATAHGVTEESDTTERLHFHFISAIVYSDSSTTVGVLEHSQGWGAESESFLTSLLLNHRF